MPAAWCSFLTIPSPDPPRRDIDPQFAARAVAQNAARPVTRAEPLDQGLHRDRVHRGLPLRRRTPAARLVQRNGKLRQLAPNPPGAMNVSDEYLSDVLQRPQKGRLLAVTVIDANPREPHPAGTRLTHDVEGVPALRSRRAHGTSGTP